MSLPSVDVVRERIEQVESEPIRFCLMACYLWAGRVKEVVGVVLPGDKSGKPLALGPVGSDVRIDNFGENQAILFNVYTEKRDGLKRVIALPEQYEPWAKPLHEYFLKAGKNKVFPFSRQKAWRLGKVAFEELKYPIEKYVIWKNGELVKTVDRHTRPFNLHALRHLRATELVEYYGFNGFELATYCGWTMRTTVGVSGQFDRYLSLNWQSYFSKLLKART